MLNNEVPRIEVISEPILQTKEPDGLAGRVAVIADIGIESDEIFTGDNYKNFIANLPTEVDKTKADFKAIEKMFIQKDDSRGVTFLEVIPIKTYDLTNFGKCLDKLETEDFDILVIPTPIKYEKTEDVTDTWLELLKSWLQARYTNKSGVGAVFGLEESSTSGETIVERMVKLAGQRGIYGVFFQPINGWSLNETIGFMSGTIAGRKLNKSLTHKVVKGINSITDSEGNNKEVIFNNKDSIGYKYMNSGVTVLRPFNRRSGEFGVLRSNCPSGYDLAIERSADYMTRQFQLVDYLGDSNSVTTLDAIAGEVNSRIFTFTNTLNLCNNIETSIQKVNHHTVEIDIKYIFDGIIDYIKVYIAIEESNE